LRTTPPMTDVTEGFQIILMMRATKPATFDAEFLERYLVMDFRSRLPRLV
jgi:hypothetical protein